VVQSKYIQREDKKWIQCMCIRCAW
jgi:hypothetical protein